MSPFKNLSENFDLAFFYRFVLARKRISIHLVNVENWPCAMWFIHFGDTSVRRWKGNLVLLVRTCFSRAFEH